MKIKAYSFRKLIKNKGELVTKIAIVPTDTVIGVVSKTPELIYKIKGRSQDKKLVLFIHDTDQIKALLPIEKDVLSKYWPGQLTIVKNNEAYRMPAHKKLLNLLKNTGPLYSSSANISGKETIKKTIEASNEFREDLKDIFIVRGKERDYYPSTIVDFDKLVVLRRGRVDGQEVLDALKGVK